MVLPRLPVSVEEVTILIRQVRFSYLDIEGDTETRPVPNVDKATFDDRVREPFDNLIPPFRLAHRILKGDVVLRQGGRYLNMRSKSYKSVKNAWGAIWMP